MLTFGDVWVPDRPVPCQQDPELWADPPEQVDEEAELGAPKKRGRKPKRHAAEVEWAIEQCDTVCPLSLACLEAAMREEGTRNSSYRFGIRGGTLPSQRETLYRKAARARRTKETAA